MSYYYKLGRIPHKRHTQFRQPDGSLYHEELMGIRGFVGDKSLLYHLRPPTDVREIDRGGEVNGRFAAAIDLAHVGRRPQVIDSGFVPRSRECPSALRGTASRRADGTAYAACAESHRA